MKELNMHLVLCMLNIVLLYLWTASEAFSDECLKEPPCYCIGKHGIKIYCKNVTNLESIVPVITKYPKIYRLVISQSNITSMPGKVFSGRSITVLAISSPLESIPDDALFGIKNLKIVNFNGTTFTGIPEGLIIPSLTTLQLVHGALTSLEEQMKNMTEIETILLYNNVITEISKDAFLETTSLQYLDLSHNKLQHLDPETFDSLGHLRSIDLSNNQLFNVDECFKSINPQTINLYGNNLKNIDNAFPIKMWTLDSLNLGKNPQLKLNLSALGDSLKNLKKLYLSEIKFDNLDPHLMDSFPKLKAIYLNKNNLMSLPANFFKNSHYLETVELNDNILSSMDGLFPNDKEEYSFKNISLSGNNFSSIALEASLESVQNLDLSRNEISFIESDAFKNLTSVTHLNLSGNALNAIEEGCFSKQHKLEVLDLSFSSLTALNGTIQHLTHLANLTIASSYLESIKEGELIALQKIKFINLKNNNLYSVYGAFRNLTSIKNLDVSMNNLTTLTKDSFPNFKRKKVNLWMADNPWACDCRISWILEWISKKDSFLKDDPVCQSPPSLNGTKIRSLKLTDVESWNENCPEICDCLCTAEGENITISVNCSGRGLNQIPEMPSNTGIINLSHNQINTFDGLSSTEYEDLKKVDLEYNSLKEIKLVLPSGMKELRLASNELGRFPIDEWNSTSLSLITLSNNSWICDCDTWGFRNWLISHNSSVLDLDDVRCGQNERSSLRNKPIITLTRDDLCPKPFQTVNIILIAAVAAAILFVCLLCFCFRNSIQTILYSCGCKCLKKRPRQLFGYDAFLLFCEEDKDFALSVIAKGLESCSPIFNLCIPTRDIQITEENDDISSVLADCSKVIVLLTRDFLCDLQSMHLFKKALSFSTTESCRRIIIVTNGELPPVSQLDSTLAALMRSCTCLRWGQFLFWEKLRYALPKKNRRSLENLFENEDSEPLIESSK
ncbi:slit homolog 1 protein-like [Stegodyphus dumicola]|uniref:slit homolog 1 protein-like n=1 Tax=Stegodyphus dumicola TaxID=202533 RepID=UPI0015A7AF68|nr:slit homolog 1 protein-like [Stegodyphus dumicola]